jgi:hypothetical protein
MTNPLIRALNRITQQEARMDDEANDRREGYCDGIGDHAPQSERSRDYADAWLDGKDDARRLSALATPAQNG